LALQGLQGFRMALELLVEDLDRDVGVAVLRLLLAQVARLEHDAHPAAAQLGLEHEAFLDDAARSEGLPLCTPAAGIVPAGGGRLRPGARGSSRARRGPEIRG